MLQTLNTKVLHTNNNHNLFFLFIYFFSLQKAFRMQLFLFLTLYRSFFSWRQLVFYKCFVFHIPCTDELKQVTFIYTSCRSLSSSSYQGLYHAIQTAVVLGCMINAWFHSRWNHMSQETSQLVWADLLWSNLKIDIVS